MEDVQVCSNWEDIADNSTALEQQLEKLRLEKAAASGEEPKIRILTRNKSEKNDSKSNEIKERPQQTQILLDSTREENLRSQYVPPEPRIKLLTRPKSNNSSSTSNGPSGKWKSQPVKTLEQREKEYKEARMRILGDVQFSDPEDVDGLTPAEVLKQKVAQAMMEGGGSEGEEEEEEEGKSSESSENGAGLKVKSKSRGKKSREKFKTPNVESPREFPVSKTDSERIVRQPRGPDGTSGFHR